MMLGVRAILTTKAVGGRRVSAALLIGERCPTRIGDLHPEHDLFSTTDIGDDRPGAEEGEMLRPPLLLAVRTDVRRLPASTAFIKSNQRWPH
jgi:hypothetical protein